MRRLLLVGGGHAHLFVLEALAERRVSAIEATLVSLGPTQAYSGMVPGLIAGRYALREVTFDLPAMCRRAGATFLTGEVTRIESARRRVLLRDGRVIEYDVLSTAAGSLVEGSDLPGVAQHALQVKPIGRVVEIVPDLERAAAHREDPDVVVVGGGAAGIEIALAVRARLRILARPRAKITVAESGDVLFANKVPALESMARRALAENGVALRLGDRVVAVTAHGVRLASGQTLAADTIVWATGAAAPTLFRDSGLRLDAEGFLLVNDRLQSLADPTVFAAGDAASPARHPGTPKAGVYAVRAGPVLARNLLAAATGKPMAATYRPQSRFLALLNTGDGRAILSYGGLAIRSFWAMWLKNRIDRRFMRRFQRGVR